MKQHEQQVDSSFTNKVRVRVCGILIQQGEILLLKHTSIGPRGYLWSPPGGGVEFGQSAQETLVREFQEETNLDIEVGNFLFTNEYIGQKHHAIELFFEVQHLSGELALGHDPELPSNAQMLSEARFFSKEALDQIPANAIHNAFCTSFARDKILDLSGLITFKD